LKKLLEPENKEELVKLLTYHVVSGNVQAKDIKDRQLIKTVEGEDLLALVHAPHVYLQDRRFEKPSDLSEVVQADVEASNGVVHVVNHVLIPEGRLL